jgi:hypothetical protein
MRTLPQHPDFADDRALRSRLPRHWGAGPACGTPLSRRYVRHGWVGRYDPDDRVDPVEILARVGGVSAVNSERAYQVWVYGARKAGWTVLEEPGYLQGAEGTLCGQVSIEGLLYCVHYGMRLRSVLVELIEASDTPMTSRRRWQPRWARRYDGVQYSPMLRGPSRTWMTSASADVMPCRGRGSGRCGCRPAGPAATLPDGQPGRGRDSTAAGDPVPAVLAGGDRPRPDLQRVPGVSEVRTIGLPPRRSVSAITYRACGSSTLTSACLCAGPRASPHIRSVTRFSFALLTLIGFEVLGVLQWPR